MGMEILSTVIKPSESDWLFHTNVQLSNHNYTSCVQQHGRVDVGELLESKELIRYVAPIMNHLGLVFSSAKVSMVRLSYGGDTKLGILITNHKDEKLVLLSVTAASERKRTTSITPLRVVFNEGDVADPLDATIIKRAVEVVETLLRYRESETKHIPKVGERDDSILIYPADPHTDLLVVMPGYVDYKADMSSIFGKFY